MNLVMKAEIFATAAHAAIGQRRKYTNEAYIVHPRDVVNTLLYQSSYYTNEMLAAAWLHDVVEDTQVQLPLIEMIFGKEVSTLVEQLTDVSKPEDGNRATRKEIDLQHTALCSPVAATIKLADLISNTKSIVHYDPQFAKVYIPEKLKSLQVLKHGCPTLWNIAYAICTENPYFADTN